MEKLNERTYEKIEIEKLISNINEKLLFKKKPIAILILF